MSDLWRDMGLKIQYEKNGSYWGDRDNVLEEGINIVVYNNETMKILDSVCYNEDIVR